MKKIIEYLNGIIMNINDIKKEVKQREQQNNLKKETIEKINKTLLDLRIKNLKGNTSAFIQQQKENKKSNERIDATMTKRKDGRYMARFYISPGCYKYVYGRTKQECNEKLVKALKEYEESQQRNILSPKMKLKDYITYYYKNISNAKETTLKVYQASIDAICNSKLGEKSISSISLEDLNNLINKMELITVKKTAVIVLKSSFSKAMEIGILKFNYAAILKQNDAPEKVEKGHKYIYIDEIKKVAQSLKEKEQYVLFLTLALTGARIGEAMALTWDDIDFDNKTIKINKQYSLSTKKNQIVKSRSSNRFVPLLKRLEQVLLDYKTNHCEYELFGNLHNKTITFRKNIKPIMPHDLRHTFATNCFILKINPKQVQTWLGHTNYSMTVDTYTHCPKINDNDLVFLKHTFKDYL